MTSIGKLNERIAYHQEQIKRIQNAIEVLMSIDGIEVDEVVGNKAVMPSKSDPIVKGMPEFNKEWSQVNKVVFFIKTGNRCLFPNEIQKLFKNVGEDVGNVHNLLFVLKKREIIQSYKPKNIPGKAHAWGLVEWFDGDKVLEPYKAKKLTTSIFD